jgi:hypothetical protein
MEWACAYIGCKPRFIMDRAIPYQPDPVPGKIRKARVATSNMVRYHLDDVTTFLP